MNYLNSVIGFVLSLKAYVMLPLIIFIIALIFRVKLAKAFKSCLTMGIGFVGIFIIFDYFLKVIDPALKSLIDRTGISYNVLDVGWPPLAAMTWSFKLAPIILVICMLVNALLVVLNLTKTVNIDIWNYWHFVSSGLLVYYVTGNVFLCIAASIAVSILILKISDWSAVRMNKFMGTSGISICTLSAACYYPIGVVMEKLIKKIPYINNIKADPEEIRRKLGIFGEPAVLGFVMGMVFAIVAGFPAAKVLELAFNIAAVVVLLPKMAEVLTSGLVPISDSIKDFINKKFPDKKDLYIGMDCALLVGSPAVVVTAILLMPICVILALILPGISFIPMGDLANVIGVVTVVVAGLSGNVVYSIIVFIPILIGKLYAATAIASVWQGVANTVGYSIEGYTGSFTSFLDGGNLLRLWVFRVFAGNKVALMLIPIIAALLYMTYRIYKQDMRKEASIKK